MIEQLGAVEGLLATAERDIDAAHGGDADAGQKARRTLLEVDAILAEADLARNWPELDAEAQQAAIIANGAVASFGTEPERRLLDEVVAAIGKARAARDVAELGRQVRLVRRLGTAAYHRNPEAWEGYFDDAASEIDSASDLPRARRLVADGRAAIEAGADQGRGQLAVGGQRLRGLARRDQLGEPRLGLLGRSLRVVRC